MYNNGLEVIFNGIFAAIVAQVLKLIGYVIKHKKFNFKILTTTGGMPSSHSAGVIGLATTAGLIEGFTSVTFAIALGYSLVVMYDAAGVRRSAGKIAAVLNRIKEDIYSHKPELIGDKLKELLGHTPFEVFVGAILGVAIAYLNHFLFSIFNI